MTRPPGPRSRARIARCSHTGADTEAVKRHPNATALDRQRQGRPGTWAVVWAEVFERLRARRIVTSYPRRATPRVRTSESRVANTSTSEIHFEIEDAMAFRCGSHASPERRSRPSSLPSLRRRPVGDRRHSCHPSWHPGAGVGRLAHACRHATERYGHRRITARATNSRSTTRATGDAVARDEWPFGRRAAPGQTGH